MANQVAARLAGDDYQHLVAWDHLLELLIPSRRVRWVTVEDPDAGSVDDVTTIYEPDSHRPDRFLQVKYHVDQRDQYSTESFLAAKPKSRSLLQKFYDSWSQLRRTPNRPVEIRLVTNWVWDPTDHLRDCILGSNNALSEDFFASTSGSAVGKARLQWQQHLGVDDDPFRDFVGALRLRLGFDCAQELEERVSERMHNLQLRHDHTALLVGTGIVRDLIKQRRHTLTKSDVEQLLKEHDLYLPADAEASTAVYITTVKTQRFDLPPDYHLDWRAHFEGDEQKRGHAVLDPSAWNETMLPALQTLEADLNAALTTRLIRARGLARLSAWLAFGHTFSDVARYILEVDQQGALWRTDAQASTDFKLREHARELIEDGDASAVAVGISVTGVLEDAVRTHLSASREARALLLLRPDRELGRECLRSAGDVVAFARDAKDHLRAFVSEHGARRLLLFYFGPLSGACFLGHQLNAVAREIQVMEDQQPGYAPSFLLT